MALGAGEVGGGSARRDSPNTRCSGDRAVRQRLQETMRRPASRTRPQGRPMVVPRRAHVVRPEIGRSRLKQHAPAPSSAGGRVRRCRSLLALHESRWWQEFHPTLVPRLVGARTILGLVDRDVLRAASGLAIGRARGYSWRVAGCVPTALPSYWAGRPRVKATNHPKSCGPEQ